MADQVYSAKVDVDYGDAVAATDLLNQQLRTMSSLFRTVGEDGEEMETAFLKGLDAANRLKGDLDSVSDQLKLYGPAGEKAAEALEGITDASLRLRLSQELLNKQLHAGKDPFVAMGNQAKALQARFHMLGPATKAIITTGFGALALAVGAAGAAIGKFVSDSVTSFVSGSVELQGKTAALEASYDRLTAKVGKVIAEHLRLDDALDASKDSVDGLSSYMDRSGEAIDGVIQTVKEIGVIGLQVFSYTLPAALTPLTGSLDALRFGTMGLFAVLTEGVAQVAEGMNELGLVSDETAASLRRGANDVTKQTAEMKSFTKTLWDTSGALRDGLDELDLTKGKIEGLGEATKKTATSYKELLTRIKGLDDELKSSAIAATGDLALKLRAAGVETNTIRVFTDDLTRSLTSGTITVEQYKEALAGLAGVSLDLKAPEVAKAKGGGDTKADSKKEKEERLQETVDEMEARKKATEDGLAAIAKMERDVYMATMRGDSPEVIAKYEDKDYIQKAEAAAAAFKKNVEAGRELEIQTQLGREANDEITASFDRMGDAMTAIRNNAIDTGLSIAELAIHTAVAGGGFDTFAKGALASLGNFASNAGKVLLWTGLGLEAIGKVFPGGAIAAGLGLMAVGAVIGGLASSMGSGGGGGGARPQGQIAAQREAWTDRNRDAKAEGAAPQVTVVAQFGDDRLEPTVTRLERSAQRNGRTSSGGRL